MTKINERRDKLKLVKFVENRPFETIDGDMIFSATAHYRLAKKPKHDSVKVTIKYGLMNKAIDKKKLPKIYLIMKHGEK